MELIPDDANNGEATLIYTYENMPVGSARAKLSKDYIKEHSIKIEIEDTSDVDKKSGDQAGGFSKTAKIVVGVLVIVLAVLVGLFVRVSIIRNRRRKRRRQKHAQMKQIGNQE